MLLPLVISSISLLFLPELIPAHYSINGQADRWGSKYEVLILPMTVIFFGLIMFAAAKFSSNDETSGKNNEKITITVNLVILLLFNALNLYFICTTFAQFTDLANAPIDLYSLIFVIFGIDLIIIGNIMPKKPK